MQINAIPFNIDLLLLKDKDVQNIRPIKVLDIFDGLSKNFHKDGLFSTEIYGKVGEERRNRLFSYINLHVDILHPVLYKALTELKAMYGEIIANKTYAVFNIKTKDFDKSDAINGFTGYAFFMENLPKMEFEARPSPKREFNIKLVNKYKNNLTFSKMVVLPAGLRDYEVDQNGKPSEDEINNLYRIVMSISEMVETVGTTNNSEYLDNARYNLQVAVNNIYDYLNNILKGKHGFMLDKWSSRKVHHSTRNVITSYVHDTASSDDPTSVSLNETVVGLYQYLRATLPLAIKHVRDVFLSDIFIGPNSPVMLVDKKNLTKVMVPIDPDYYDSWMTNEGLESLFSKFGQENLRHDIVEIDNYYLALIYKGLDNSFKVFHDINDLPTGLSKDRVYPITLTELIYLSVFRDAQEVPCLVTRYPVTGYGSIYPSYCYLKTTAISEVRYELGHNWEKTDVVAKEFPVSTEGFFNSISVNHSHLGRLGGDFDGDTVSFMALLTDDSKKEIKNALNSKSYYVGVNNKMSFSVNTDIISLVLSSITG